MIEKFKTYSISILLVIVLITILDSYKKSIELQEVKLVYNNPKKVINTIVKEGPTRTITKTVIKPQETIIIEYRDILSKETSTHIESNPTPITDVFKSYNQDRILLGIGNNNFNFKNTNEYKIFGGYSFKNRIDLLAGLGYQDKIESQLLIILRF